MKPDSSLTPYLRRRLLAMSHVGTADGLTRAAYAASLWRVVRLDESQSWRAPLDALAAATAALVALWALRSNPLRPSTELRFGESADHWRADHALLTERHRQALARVIRSRWACAPCGHAMVEQTPAGCDQCQEVSL